MRLALTLGLLFAPIIAAAAPSYYGWGAGAFIQGPEEADETAPTILRAEIIDDGDGLRWTPSETITSGAGGTGGATLTSCSGGAVTLTYVSAGATVEFDTSRTVANDETGCVTGYTQPGDGFEDSAGNDLATFSDLAVSVPSGQCTMDASNDSTQDATYDATGDMLCVGF